MLRRDQSYLRQAALISLVFVLATMPTRGWCDAPSALAAKAQHGVVVSVSPAASDIGVKILQKGGNAVDAAVATAFALAVTHPAAGNIGGGGFMLVYPADKSEPVVIDYRETAPAAASKDTFVKQQSLYGHRVVGVPGTVRGLALAHQRYGKLPWSEVIQPAIALAGDGIILDSTLANSLNALLCKTKDFSELQRVYGKKNGTADWEEGDLLVQKDLAETLRLIAHDGPDAFYRGAIADKIAAEMQSGQGLITKADLVGYQAKVRAPIHGTYRGYDVYGPPPPSSGGICLVEMLNILENFELSKQDRWSAQTLHIMVEAMRRAFCDRARYLGDTDFVSVPPHLTSKEYGRTLAQQIDLKHATPSAELAKDIPLAAEGDSTTHFSVIDKDGMAVSNTYTLERGYGSRVVVKGTGFLLNDEMTDFNWRPGYTNRSGAIGTEANQVAPGKRMLSSMTPTIVAHNGKVLLVTGSPGSRTIINTVLCILTNVLDYDMDIRTAVDAPRLHHSWFPDEVRFEGMSEYPDAVKQLRQLGHKVAGTRQGDAHSIWVDPKTGLYYGAEDRRLRGKASGY